ncbi:MAG: NusG domain II-containing protein [Eubacteriales bacterium]|nr:NusG domain II-containing protein [Eubacteriales bacterium]
MQKNTRNTCILLVILIVIALTSLICVKVFWEKHGDYAVVSSDGKEIMRLNLDEDTTKRVESPYGGYNIIEVKDHTVCVKESDCENQLCVMQGKIKESTELIICLPHTLVISIENK